MADFRNGQFGGGPELAQLGGVGQQAQPQVPGLLQMAQAAMDGGGAGGGGQFDRGGQFGGGPSSFSESDIPFGAEVRPITSPQDQNWSDAQGRPIHVGGPAPSYTPQTTLGGFNAVFDPRHPSKDGGWFTTEDYFKGNPQTLKSGNPYGSNKLSTNNWRLLPPNYQTPDYFMVDGGIVSRTAAARELAPKSVMGQEGGGFPGYWPMGGGVWGTPVSSHGWTQGLIGGGNWGMTSTPTY